MRIRRQPKKERPAKPGKGPTARIRRSRHNRPEPGQVKMVVAQGEGRILGWQMPSGEFVPLGKNCCQDPFACTKCWGPVDPPWWARWRR